MLLLKMQEILLINAKIIIEVKEVLMKFMNSKFLRIFLMIQMMMLNTIKPKDQKKRNAKKPKKM